MSFFSVAFSNHYLAITYFDFAGYLATLSIQKSKRERETERPTVRQTSGKTRRALIAAVRHATQNHADRRQ